MTTSPVRHGRLKHLIAGLEDNPHTQYKVHLSAVRWRPATSAHPVRRPVLARWRAGGPVSAPWPHSTMPRPGAEIPLSG